MKKVIQIILFSLFAAVASAQVQNMQAQSGTTGDLTKPTGGFNLASGQTLNVKTGATISGAGSYDFTNGTKLIVPNSAAPTTSAFGWLAADNNAWAASRGALQFFDGTANTYIIGVLASSTPSNGMYPQWNTGGTITWVAPTGSGANPTASVGLTAVNGSATTNMRSDGAPALDVSIAPTWTGVHIFTPAARSTGALPYLSINAPADTLQTTGTNAIGVKFVGATRQHAGSTGFNDQDEWDIGAPTYTGQNATATIVNASTLTVEAAPTASTNITITNPFAVRLKSGALGFGPSGSIAKISSSSGDMTLTASGTNQNINLTPSGTGFAQYNQGGSVGWVVNSTGSGSSNINFAISGVSGALILEANGTNSGATGSIDKELVLRGSLSGISFSSDNGASIAGRFVASTGQFILLKPTAPFGYATGLGTGGAVTQTSSRTTGVTLNNVTGAITLVSAAGSASWTTFTVTDSAVTARDTVTVTPSSGSTDTYVAVASQAAAGSFKISFQDITGTTTEQPVFNFTVTKGSNN